MAPLVVRYLHALLIRQERGQGHRRREEQMFHSRDLPRLLRFSTHLRLLQERQAVHVVFENQRNHVPVWRDDFAAIRRIPRPSRAELDIVPLLLKQCMLEDVILARRDRHRWPLRAE
eukprot:2613995-Rhodomonas_salina.1